MNTPAGIVVAAALLYLFSQRGAAFAAPGRWITPPEGQQYDWAFRAAERRYKLPPGFLSRIAYQESRYDPNARGASGEIGLMQITPKWHPGVDPHNPVASINYAGSLFRRYYNEFGSWDAAIAAYNWGETNVRRKGVYRAPSSTLGYIRDVKRDVGLA